jgi:two-component system nitrogen regulation sensor histidine kinase NtrY
MDTPIARTRIAVFLSFVGLALLFAEQLAPGGPLARVVPWASLILAALSMRIAARRGPWSSFFAAVLAAGLFVLLAVHRDDTRVAELWRKNQSRSITEMLGAVGGRVQRLQELSTTVGDETGAFVLAAEVSSAEDSLAFRLEAFRFLETQARRITDSGELPPGTEIGIQLLKADGERLAWAGWPQRLHAQDLRFVSSGVELVYSRQVSLYQILSHVIPVRDAAGGIVATSIIDMPLEVNYRVSNKFLKSTSFADNITAGRVASVRFDYTPSAFNLPGLMDRYGKALAERQRVAEPTGGGVGIGREDSVLSYAGFPAIIEPMGEIAGDENAGLSGRILIHSNLGNPLCAVTVSGRPLRYFADSHERRSRTAAAVLAVLAVVIFVVLSMRAFPSRLAGPLGIVKALYLVVFLVLLRYWLGWFLGSLVNPQTKLFDPAIFATPVLGGLMRSAGDLLITSILFVGLVYGVLKIARAAGRQPITERGRVPFLFVFKGLVAAGVLFGAFELADRFAKSVVVNANPRLVGETMRLFESYAVVLHLATFLMVSGIFLAAMMGIWGVYRLGGTGDTRASSLVAAAAILIVALVAWHWEVAAFPWLLLLLVIFAPRVVQREDLVSIVLAAFCFVIVVSAATYVFLNGDYQALRRTFIQERVTELTHPSDNWKVFILEDVLEGFSQNSTIRKALSGSSAPDLQRLAFDLWAGSSLSLLGYSSAIHVFDAQDSLVSRFTVEMPYRVQVTDTSERLETDPAQEWVVLDLATSTPRGMVRYYRGIVNIGDFMPMDGVPSPPRTGRVVVDIPFFFENLAWAARTGPQTPEVLRNVQEGGIEPRLEETEALLLARLSGTRVVETSSDVLPVGFGFAEAAFDKALSLEWPLLQTTGAPYRYLVQEDAEAGRYLFAGFPVPSPLQHLLRWSTILSLYFFFAVSIIVVLIALKSVRFLRPVLPSLTPGRELAFQRKLLASFLGIALLPSVILGVFSVGLIKDRFVQENKKEALSKAFSAQKSLSNLLAGELDYLLDHSDLRELVRGKDTRALQWGTDRVIRVFVRSGDPAGAYREVGEVSLEPGDAHVASADSLIERFSDDQVFVDWAAGEPYLAVFSRPIAIARGKETETFVMYYARRIDEELLSEMADQVGADINLYDRGELIATSREGLLFGGFISSMMNSDAFVRVSLMDVDESVVTERAGDYTYEVAYVPVPAARSGGRAAVGLPLLFAPESYHVEVQKASSIVLSIFALLSAATMGLGLLLARGIFEPLKGLLEGTKRISRGDLAFRLPSKSRDEIGTVVEAFNEMTNQLSRSQNALEERRRYLEVILANVGTGVISTDADDRIRAVNSAAERILHIKSADVIDKKGNELVGQDVVPRFFALLTPHDTSDEPFVSSEIDVTLDGRLRTIKYMKTRLSTDGHYVGTVYVFEDLTELINSKKLSAWVEMARQIAHEIKNPLTPIKLSAQFMVKAHEENADDFGKILKESSETIIKQVDVLRHIASEFSSFGRLQQLKITPQRVAARLHEIAAPYERNTSGVVLTLTCDDEDMQALADPEALRKICANLIENAMEAMHGGGRLDVTCTKVMREGEEQVRISFRDTGPGLSEEAKRKLFEPYFSTKTTGTGLGLAICRSLSREMGGDVVVGNVRGGKGVEASLYLRVAS